MKLNIQARHRASPQIVQRARAVRRQLLVTAAAAAASSSALAKPELATPYFQTDTRPIILFDGVCNLCNGGVNFMLDWDTAGAFRFAALQSPAGAALLQACGRLPDDISSIVLVERDAHHLRSEAILRIGARLNLPLAAMATLGLAFPLPVRDYMYDAVADNRYYLLGRQDSCRLSDTRFADRFIAE